MSPNRRPVAGSTGRLVWIVAAVVLVLLIGLSFLMSSGARQDAEAEAELRAEAAVAGLSTLLTPELVEGDILGSSHRDLLPSVQSGVMADERIVRVRIWKPGGDLIFSTALRDEIETFVAVDNVQIRQAADGQTVSVVAGVTAAPLAGLEGSDVDLFVTYVPLRFPNETEPPAVVEIDQEYAAVQEASDRLWRPVQIGLFVALGGLAVLFGMSQRRGRARASARYGSKPQRVTRDERNLRDAEDRAIAAERAAREAERRLADAERRLEEFAKAEVPPEIRTRLDELELKIRAEQAEREQVAGEAKRLRSALSEREAQLALIRDKTVSTEAEKVRSIDAVQRAEQQTAEAERRAAAAGTLAAEAEGRAAGAESKVVELETALRDADRRLTVGVAEARRSAEEARRDDESKAVTDLRAAQLEVNDLQLKLAEAETALRVSEAGRAEGEGAAAELVRIRGEADGARAELEEARLEIQRTRLELEARNDEVDDARIELQASHSELEAARTELEVARGDRDREAGELERIRGELGQKDDEAQRLAAEREQMGAEVQRLIAEREEAERGLAEREAAAPQESDDAAPDVSGLEARLAEMESDRRSERADLQRAQESLANTQFELMEATRRLKASEEHVRELEGAAEGPARAPEPIAPSADDLEIATPPPARPPRAPVRRRPAPETEEPSEEEPSEEEPSEELPEEALSLRERLTRAAAARHRTAQPPD